MAPGRLSIDTEALRENWRRLAKVAAPAECAAVIKADAYGLGVSVAAPAFASAGARTFFVAHSSEGLLARRTLGPGPRIFILNGLEPETNASVYREANLIPALGSGPELQRWSGAGDFALHVDTGMNRLGVALGDIDPALRPVLLMSHLTEAEVPTHPANARQSSAFAEARAILPDVPASLANSSGIFLPDRPHYALVRPGYALYGGNPTPGRDNPMRTVVTLEIEVQQTRWIEPGETCGYNGRWTAKRRTRLATLLAGYADGLPFGAGATDAAAGTEVWLAGAMCPLVGRISMDLCIADVTDAPEAVVQHGARAEFIGPHADLDAFAARAGTIGYNVLTGLGRRYEREIRVGSNSLGDQLLA